MRSEVKSRLASFKKQADMASDWGQEIVYAIVYSSKNPDEVEKSVEKLADWIMKVHEKASLIIELGVLQEPESLRAEIDQFMWQVTGTIENHADRWKEGQNARTNIPADMNSGTPMYGQKDQSRDIKTFLEELKKRMIESWTRDYKDDDFIRSWYRETKGPMPEKDFSIMQRLFEVALSK